LGNESARRIEGGRLVKNRWFTAASLACVLVFTGPLATSQVAYAELNLPDDPVPSAQQAPPDSGTPAPPAQSAATPATHATDPQTAAEQLKLQEKQRVFGVMATFNTTTNKDALPLSTGQKYQLFFKSASDPWPFVLTAFGAGIDQAENSFPEYGQGMEGYAKRFGAGYTDYFTGNLLGNAVLASLLKEDPRYFQKGTGSSTSRFLWAASSTVWCKRDNGTWGPNYANVVGNLMGAAVSNLYYPASDRTAADTIERGFTVTAEAIVGSEVIEFWPDMVRHHRRKQAEKLARQMSQNGTPGAAPRPASQPVPVSPAPRN
jgi:hypothetical protein